MIIFFFPFRVEQALKKNLNKKSLSGIIKGKTGEERELAATSSLLLEKSEAMPSWAAAASWDLFPAAGTGRAGEITYLLSLWCNIAANANMLVTGNVNTTSC